MDQYVYNDCIRVPPLQSYPPHSCLFIPSIVNEILSYSSYTELRSHRNVCKVWNEEASKHLRQFIFVDFDQNKRVKEYHQDMEGRKDYCEHFRVRVQGLSLALTEFLQDFGYYIRNLELIGQIGLPRSELLCILYRLVPNLEELSLGIVDLFKLTPGLFPNRQKDETIPALPKLKKLELSFGMMEEVETKLLIRDLILIMPNLEEISVPKQNNSQLNIQDIIYICQQHMQAGMEDGIEDFLEILEPHIPWLTEIVETFLDDDSLTNLKTINIPLRLNNEQIRKLELKKLPLEDLSLELDPKVSPTVIDKLFRSLSKSLKNLSVKYFHAIKAKCDINFTKCNQFERLTSVHLNSFHGSLNFLENIPTLKSLTLTRIYFSRSVLLQSLDSNNPHGLQSLKVYEDLGSLCAPSAVGKVTRYLPHLTILRLEKLDDEGLQLVFANCPLLEELEIVRGFFSDQGTTGIHPNAYRVIQREDSYDYINPDVFRQGPHFGLLKNLRRLDIGAPKITDVTIILGIMSCKKLRQLSVSSYGMTDGSLIRLVDGMNLISLKTEMCNQLTNSAVEYAKTKLHGLDVSLNEYKGPIDRKRIPGFIRESRFLKVSLPCLRL